MHARNGDLGFDDFRKERKRIRAKLGPANSVLGYENHALRELEEVEAREVRDQQLTREVHEFFASATRQAAGIVERVSRDAQVEAGQRIEQEMEAFLIDALARMNTFVVTVIQQKRGPIAETRMEPCIGNLVGKSLDEFRWAGTADTGDKHIGQDPFATDVDDVRREFRTQVPEGKVAHDGEAAGATAEATPESAAAAPTESPATTAPAEPAAAEATSETAQAATGPSPTEELERFKTALKALVRQGTMTRDEARAAWQTRMQSLGLAKT
jgi:hypothetical protein